MTLARAKYRDQRRQHPVDDTLHGRAPVELAHGRVIVVSVLAIAAPQRLGLGRRLYWARTRPYQLAPRLISTQDQRGPRCYRRTNRNPSPGKHLPTTTRQNPRRCSSAEPSLFAPKSSGLLLGDGLLVFIERVLDQPTRDAMQLPKAVPTRPQILECHLVTGGFDYLVKTRVADMQACRLFRRLGDLEGSGRAGDTHVNAVMGKVMNTTALPL